jgi:predicted enzyme related to lactoylglutathione lyase
MPAAKINHIAIVSENYALSGKFYESIFGMSTSSKSRPARAVTVGDGYVGLNINPRKPGRPARLDHFGIQLEDFEATLERVHAKYPRIEWVRRPATRPFAAVTTHDPDGNVFDLSEKRSPNRKDVYAEERPLHERYIDHFALRTLNPDAVAQFYAELFGLTPRDVSGNGHNRYVSDGHVTMVIMPWHITDFEGTGIVSPSLDHIGFTVESLERFRADVERVAGDNPRLSPIPVGAGPEGKARLDLAERSCPLCSYHLSDVDGIFLSAREPD